MYESSRFNTTKKRSDFAQVENDFAAGNIQQSCRKLLINTCIHIQCCIHMIQ